MGNDYWWRYREVGTARVRTTPEARRIEHQRAMWRRGQRKVKDGPLGSAKPLAYEPGRGKR